MTPDELMRMAHLRDVAKAAATLAWRAIPNDCPGPCNGPLIEMDDLRALWNALNAYHPQWHEGTQDVQ